MATDNKKHLQIVTAARELFWKHGFRRVSIDEICEKAGASKMTFYRFFPNKVELAKVVFEREIERGVTAFRELLAEKSPADDKIRRMLKLKLEGTHDISREFLQDFYGDREPGLREFIERRTAETWEMMIQDFRKAQDDGWFRKDFKPEFLLFYTQKLAGLVSDEKLLALYESPQALVMELSNFVSYGISPRKDEPIK